MVAASRGKCSANKIAARDEGRITVFHRQRHSSGPRTRAVSFASFYTGIASAVQDALTVGIKVDVREGEPIGLALRRFKKLLEMARVRTSRGPFYWMRGLTRDYYRKPSVLKRIKYIRKRFWAAKETAALQGRPLKKKKY